MKPTEREWRAPPEGLRSRPRAVVPMVAVLAILILLATLAGESTAALGSLYAIPVMVSLWIGSRRFTLAVAWGSCVPAAIGLLRDQGWSTAEGLVNVSASLFSIAIVTSLGLMRLRAERRLFDTRQTAITTLTSIADAVITTDVRGEVRFVNPVAERMTGFSREEAVGRPLEAVLQIAEERVPRPPLEELEELGYATTSDALLVSRDGRRVPIEQRRAPIRDADGALHGSVIVFRDVTQRREHEEAMRRMAYRDPLTGLPNRISLGDRLGLEIAHARRNRESLALLYLDLDGFKEVNDALGHHAGDALLRGVAERLRRVLRGGDTVARLGGDEFVLVLPGISGADEARRVGQKILEALRVPFGFEGRELSASASIGLALYPRDGEEPETLLRRADKAMYRAKQLGRGRVA